MLGETLLITIQSKEEVTYEDKKNITLIKDENGALVGLNIFNVENLKLDGEGSIDLTEDQKEILQKRLEKNGIKIDLEGNNDEFFVVGEVLSCEKAMMPSGLLIKKSKLRGVESNGMLCSKRELGLPQEEARGILVLDADTKVGTLVKDLNLK